MADETTLKIECAKLQNNIKLMEDDLAQLQSSVARNAATAEIGRKRVVELEQRKFAEKQQADKQLVDQECDRMRQQVDELLDTFPDMATKEFSGKYEIKGLEEKLEELYPKELLSSYICSNPITFKDEGDAYAAYAYVERSVVKLSSGSMAGSLFNSITNTLDRVCSDSLVGKISLAIMGALMLLMLFSPFLFLTIFSVVGISAAVHGSLINSLFRNLYSVKMFLNNAYDEDLFQDNKSEILDSVDEFIAEVKETYYGDIDARNFSINPKILEDFDKNIEAQKQSLNARILQKEQALEDARKKAAELLEELEKATAARERQAAEAYEKYLNSIDWKFEWADSMLIDISPEKRVVGCKWLRGNTLYYSKDLDQLQQMQFLVVLQSATRMHPSFAGQVCLDYKYQGGSLIPFSRLNPTIFSMCSNEEDIEKRIDRMRIDIRARTETVLQTSPSLEDFNALMKEYGATGESYVVVHICGLKSFTPQLLSFLKNGPRVGYFFKIYLTVEELKAFGKEFPFDDIPEYAEVSEITVSRTVAQVRRIIADGT